MTVRQPRYSKEEFARRGDEIYETRARSLVEEGNRGKIVAIDIETGEFEIADDILTATDRLFDRIPSAQPWIVRVGYRAVHRFGTRLRPADSSDRGWPRYYRSADINNLDR